MGNPATGGFQQGRRRKLASWPTPRKPRRRGAGRRTRRGRCWRAAADRGLDSTATVGGAARDLRASDDEHKSRAPGPARTRAAVGTTPLEVATLQQAAGNRAIARLLSGRPPAGNVLMRTPKTPARRADPRKISVTVTPPQAMSGREVAILVLQQLYGYSACRGQGAPAGVGSQRVAPHPGRGRQGCGQAGHGARQASGSRPGRGRRRRTARGRLRRDAKGRPAADQRGSRPAFLGQDRRPVPSQARNRPSPAGRARAVDAHARRGDEGSRPRPDAACSR